MQQKYQTLISQVTMISGLGHQVADAVEISECLQKIQHQFFRKTGLFVMTSMAKGGLVTYQGNDKPLIGSSMEVLTFWLFAQTTLNVAPDMQRDLGLDASMMNIAVAITALFSGAGKPIPAPSRDCASTDYPRVRGGTAQPVLCSTLL